MHVSQLLIYLLCLDRLLDFGTDVWFSQAGALPPLSRIFTDISTKGFFLRLGHSLCCFYGKAGDLRLLIKHVSALSLFAFKILMELCYFRYQMRGRCLESGCPSDGCRWSETSAQMSSISISMMLPSQSRVQHIKPRFLPLLPPLFKMGNLQVALLVLGKRWFFLPSSVCASLSWVVLLF